jgi:hypothetical protein
MGAIEDAYDRLFDRYEPKAQEGDTEAIDMLNALNDARDTLVDPRSRAALDRSLAQGLGAAGDEGRKRREERSRPSAPVGTSRSAAPSSRPSSVRARSRVRYVETRPQRNIASMMPLFIIAAFLLFALGVAITYLISRGPTTPVGDVVATVNGEPIYRQEFDDQVTKDRNAAINDPMFGVLFNNFQGITGTRMLDSLKFDSLDKLINMKVILQQAKKEGNYPTDSMIDGMVAQAKQADLQPNQTFESFLQQHAITPDQYRKAVTENVVYSVMANQHMPKEGTADEKTEGFIRWICTTRQSYDVKIMMEFIVKDNPSCTSGLPSNMPLPGIDETALPEPEGTVAPELTPGAQATPQTTP